MFGTNRARRFRRTRNRSVGTKYAAIAGKRFEHGLAAFALIEKDARVRGHDLGLFVTAPRTCNFGFEFGVVGNIYHKFTKPCN